MVDFVLLAYSTEGDEVCPRTCLLGERYFNPRRVQAQKIWLSSNNGGVASFVLVDSKEEASCESETKKEALRKARLARSKRNVIVYSWPEVQPRLTTITLSRQPSEDCTSTPSSLLDETAGTTTTPRSPSQAEEINVARYNNKFGTPIPARRATDEQTTPLDGIPMEKTTREERTSSDSIMDTLVS